MRVPIAAAGAMASKTARALSHVAIVVLEQHGYSSSVKHVLTFLIIGGLLTSGTAKAGGQVGPATRALARIVTLDPVDYSRAGRAKLVKALAAYCQEVLAGLPTNTPAEDE